MNKILKYYVYTVKYKLYNKMIVQVHFNGNFMGKIMSLGIGPTTFQNRPSCWDICFLSEICIFHFSPIGGLAEVIKITTAIATGNIALSLKF